METFGPEGIIKGKDNLSFKDIEYAISNQKIISVIPMSTRGNKIYFRLNYFVVGRLDIEDLVDTEYNKNESIEYKVGKTMNVVPTEMTIINGKRIVECSRALAQKICRENYISKLQVGDIIDAKVINITKCGVFCDIGCGNIALMTMNDIAMSYVNNARDVFKTSQFIKVVIKNNTDPKRIMLSMKELLGTWNEVIQEFNKGDIVVGKVIIINEYGAFIRLRYNLVGLIDKFSEELKVNDFITVKIDYINYVHNRIKLTMIGMAEPIKENIKYYYRDNHIDNWEYIENGSNDTQDTWQSDHGLVSGNSQ